MRTGLMRDPERRTPPRHQTTLAVAEVYRRACAGDDVIELLHELLVETLEPREREIYQWFLAGGAGGYTTSAEVAQAWEMTQSDASTILKLLTDVGLLERASYAHAHGRLFYYGLPGVADEVFS